MTHLLDRVRVEALAEDPVRRRMLARDVEGGEVVEIVLDVRALGDAEAHGTEDGDDLVDGLADGMEAALGLLTGFIAHAEAASLRALGVFASSTESAGEISDGSGRSEP